MERKMLQRLFHGQSFPTNIDETGRLVLPAKLRQKIDLDGEAFFIAAGDTFQIWNPKTYEVEELAKTEVWLDGLPDDFDPLVYLDGPKGE
jgi:MraZ protein